MSIEHYVYAPVVTRMWVIDENTTPADLDEFGVGWLDIRMDEDGLYITGLMTVRLNIGDRITDQGGIVKTAEDLAAYQATTFTHPVYVVEERA